MEAREMRILIDHAKEFRRLWELGLDEDDAKKCCEYEAQAMFHAWEIAESLIKKEGVNHESNSP